MIRRPNDSFVTQTVSLTAVRRRAHHSKEPYRNVEVPYSSQLDQHAAGERHGQVQRKNCVMQRTRNFHGDCLES